MVIALEEEIKHLREDFGDEKLYQDPVLLKQHQNRFDKAEKELELLYRAYEYRLG